MKSSQVRYLIVGGGQAAAAAAKAIRKGDPTGSLTLVTDEAHPPYKRPPLSKGLWKGEHFESLDLKTGVLNAELILGRSAQNLAVAARVVTLDDGTNIGYDRLLLATGARARRLPNLPDSEMVVSYRTLADYEQVRSVAGEGRHVVVIGGGFIGSEMAAALRLAGCEVSMVFPEDAIGAGRFPPALAHSVSAYYRERGIRLHPKRGVASGVSKEDNLSLTLDDGTELSADLIVVGIGATPNDELASAAGLLTDDGVVVDEQLRAVMANEPGGEPLGIYAAGDVASFKWPGLGRRMRIEHEDNAYSMGAAAGRAMVASLQAGSANGTPNPYQHLPFFYSDLFDRGYEAVGLLDTRLEVVEDWREPLREGVVYYLDDDQVKGVLLWNTWGQVDEARDLIASTERFSSAELMGRLPR